MLLWFLSGQAAACKWSKGMCRVWAVPARTALHSGTCNRLLQPSLGSKPRTLDPRGSQKGSYWGLGNVLQALGTRTTAALPIVGPGSHASALQSLPRPTERRRQEACGVPFPGRSASIEEFICMCVCIYVLHTCMFVYV